MTTTVTPPTDAQPSKPRDLQQRGRRIVAVVHARPWSVIVAAAIAVLLLTVAYALGQRSVTGAADDEVVGLEVQVTRANEARGAAERRIDGLESSLDAARAQSAARDVELSVRADELDAREAAVTTRETAATAVEQAVVDAQIPGGGTYVVGEDVAAGTYKSEDNDGCYYAFMDGSGSDADIIDNNIGDGLMRVTLEDGDIFQTNRCNPWAPA